MEEPLETAELLAFTTTVDAHSLSRAALELGLPRATVGRRLQRLEERLGVRLLRRTTRSLALTDAGEALYRQARLALDAVKEAENSVRRTDAAVRGDLRVSVPPITNPTFYALLNDFAVRHPEVKLIVHFSTEHVDLKRGGYDVAIRGTGELEPGLVARHLGRTSLIAVASPDYVQQHGAPRTLRDLKEHRCLLGFARGELPQTHWTDRKGRRAHVEGRIASNDIVFLAQAALRGLGVVLLPAAMVQSYLDEGRLVQVLESAFGWETRMAIVYPEREFLPPQVRAFVDAVVGWVESDPSVLWPAPTKGRGPRRRGG
jgi:DNA-binding transcriptional LysR family regulator